MTAFIDDIVIDDERIGCETSETADYTDPVDGATVASQTIVNVTNDATLAAAISGASCGRGYCPG